MQQHPTQLFSVCLDPYADFQQVRGWAQEAAREQRGVAVLSAAVPAASAAMAGEQPNEGDPAEWEAAADAAPEHYRLASFAGFPTGRQHPLVKASEARLAVAMGATVVAYVPDPTAQHADTTTALLSELVAVREAVPKPACLLIALDIVGEAKSDDANAQAEARAAATAATAAPASDGDDNAPAGAETPAPEAITNPALLARNVEAVLQAGADGILLGAHPQRCEPASTRDLTATLQRWCEQRHTPLPAGSTVALLVHAAEGASESTGPSAALLQAAEVSQLWIVGQPGPRA